MRARLGLFARDAAERVISTSAQAAVALLLADGVSDAFSVDWKAVVGVAGLAGLTALLKAFAALKLTGTDTISPASLTK